MFRTQKNGAELADKLAEIDRLRKSEEVLTARQAGQVGTMLDLRLREYQKLEREGEQLIQQGVTLDKLNEIMRKLGSEVE